MEKQIVSIEIDKDFETAERCGAVGTFQICNVFGYDSEGEEHDLTKHSNQGRHYYEDQEVLEDIKGSCREYDFEHCEIL